MPPGAFSCPWGQSRFQSRGRGNRAAHMRASARMVARSTHEIPQAHRQSVASGVTHRAGQPSPHTSLPNLGGVVPVGTPCARTWADPSQPFAGAGAVERLASDEWRVASDKRHTAIRRILAFIDFLRPLGVRPGHRFGASSNRDAKRERGRVPCSRSFFGGPSPATHRRYSGKRTPAVVAPLQLIPIP